MRVNAARGRPIIVEWERDARHSAGLSLVRSRVRRSQLTRLGWFGNSLFGRRRACVMIWRALNGVYLLVLLILCYPCSRLPTFCMLDVRNTIPIRETGNALATSLVSECPWAAITTYSLVARKLIYDPQSTVFGSVTDGVFEGKIVSGQGAFYVEHARRYFPPNGTRTRVHSVIYRESDVTDPYAHRRHGE
ncbi:Disintegrin and metalloproteinase domain-containing protein 10 homolog [Eumeta japonica]|uniref:Disintegrin and metalloproteinase domain-containing protein 10 homolog n=1 Tax=Eumeta variegata TaxID=151549 RepID=A0A4C1T622_EUMVA|nr:Disintegrin and metalloproteinase domain-containing protein 10 homolog [Eumeta japonica]